MATTTIDSAIFENLVAKFSKYAKENSVVLGASAATTLILGLVVLQRSSMRRDGSDYSSQLSGSMKILNNEDHTLKGDEFKSSVTDYENMFGGARTSTGAITSEESVNLRKQRYADMVNHFYNLVTDFYEWGWGQSFHFAPRFHNETFNESLKRAEYFLAARLGMNSKTKALDVGCGVGGPMRNMAVFSGCSTEGITINQYQVNIGNKYHERNGLKDRCKSIQGDFQNLPWPDQTFDVAYQIEATCHSPDRVHTFKGIARCLKPGGLFAGYEWAMLDNYSPKDADHVRVKEGIEVGNGLPTLVHYSVIVKNLEDAGFEVIEHFDANRGQHNSNEIPWYDTLNGKMSISGFRMTYVGRMCTHTMIWWLELLRVAPKGTTMVSSLLNATALDLVEAGKKQIFTPSYYFLAKKK
jgi:sterol 24-C-methyltransferase